MCAGLLKWILFIWIFTLRSSDASYVTEEKLHQFLFGNGYNKHIRPTIKFDDVIDVTMKLSVRQIVDLNERRMVMTTNVWVDQTWQDIHLKWNPADYGNITKTRVPWEYVWSPDIVLIESADGNYTATQLTKVTIHHDGRVKWNPPAIYKSSCAIDATFFPFDMQNCTMKFASWSYDARQVNVNAAEDAVTFEKFTYNGEWDVVDIHVIDSPTREIGDDDDWAQDVFSHPQVIFCFILRRLPLFYCTFLIAPCIGISFLTSLVFYLPSASQEKITLSISVLLAHIFYLLVITEIMPSSSTDIPLIAEYLLSNMVFITLSIVLTTIILNIHYRSFKTHRSLPGCLRSFIFETAPRLLWMQRPDTEAMTEEGNVIKRLNNKIVFQKQNLLMGRHLLKQLKRCTDLPDKLCNELGGTIESGFFIAERIKRKMQRDQESEEWIFVASVLDRIFFVTFVVISILGAVILILPSWFDNSYAVYKHRTYENTDYSVYYARFL